MIVTITVIAILAGATTGIVIYIAQILIYTPREARARAIAHDIMETIIEGEAEKRGIRYAKEMLEASSTQVTYMFGYPGNNDERNMRFSFSSNKISRSYTAFGDPISGPPSSYTQPPELVPYYAAGDISISGYPASPNVIFKYYNASGALLADPVPANQLNTIRRIEVYVTVTTGMGEFSRWEGSFKTTSSVEIKQYI